jgi:cysteinyl-tRNA synthetase
MYVCGMTVYDYCHLGHARVMVVFDAVVRWLRTSNFDVDYVRNITDIDDKIIKRALEKAEPIEVLTQRFIDAMDEDAAALGVIKPDHEPRATQHVDGMLAMIGKLIERGVAYAVPGGDVYYSVRDFAGYGKLSGKSLEDLRAGERVDVDTAKRDPLDFVLWKAAKPDEPAWDSPWGKGRPGWHIECSVMSEHHLGAHFDIHGGGQDLQFPHHENEIAQSEGAHGHTFVNYWMHNGFVRVDDEKMSKSLGNFFTVREVLRKYDPEVVRFFILRAHYRSPLNYSDQHLDGCRTSSRSGARPLSSVFMPQWTTISIRPRRSRSCSIWSATSIASERMILSRRPARQRSCADSALSWDSCRRTRRSIYGVGLKTTGWRTTTSRTWSGRALPPVSPRTGPRPIGFATA